MKKKHGKLRIHFWVKRVKYDVINKQQTEKGNLITPKHVMIYICEYFSSEGTKQSKDTQKSNKTVPKIVLSEVLLDSTICFNPCSVNEIEKVISRMHSNSVGVDGISLKID